MSLYIDIHTHKTPVRQAGVLSMRSVLVKGAETAFPEGFYSAGIHPWDASRAQDEWLDVFASGDAGLVAVGETGLDYREQYEPYQAQLEWFEKQVGIAEKLGLPVVIHNVRAQGDILKTLKGRDIGWVIHGFTGGPESAQTLVDAGGYVSFGEGLFHSDRTAGALRAIPSGRIFFETDESDMRIADIYGKAAEILNMSEKSLKERIEDNFRNVFTRAAL